MAKNVGHGPRRILWKANKCGSFDKGAEVTSRVHLGFSNAK